MKLLFDQNISHRILDYLAADFIGSSCIKTEKLINAPDLQIWHYAKKEGFTIVSQDSDFNALYSLYGHPPKIIWLRTGNLTTKALAQLLASNRSSLEKFSARTDLGCLELYLMNTMK